MSAHKHVYYYSTLYNNVYYIVMQICAVIHVYGVYSRYACVLLIERLTSSDARASDLLYEAFQPAAASSF